MRRVFSSWLIGAFDLVNCGRAGDVFLCMDFDHAFLSTAFSLDKRKFCQG